MRDLKTYLKDITVKPPVLFPTVALFHIVLLVVAIVSAIKEPGTSTGFNVLWMVAFTIFWMGLADQRKWGAFGYVAFTVADIIIHYTAKQQADITTYGSPIFFADIVFCLFVLFYFKRFR